MNKFLAALLLSLGWVTANSATYILKKSTTINIAGQTITSTYEDTLSEYSVKRISLPTGTTTIRMDFDSVSTLFLSPIDSSATVNFVTTWPAGGKLGVEEGGWIDISKRVGVGIAIDSIQVIPDKATDIILFYGK